MSVSGNYTVETPEAIEVSYELAGPGSRFCAMVIDTLLLWLITFVFLVVLAILGAPLLVILGQDDGAAWGLALLIIAFTVVFFGYYLFFELILRGQTPGKRKLKLRVIRDDGTPAEPLDIAIRNLVRLVDALGFYAVGGVAVWLSPKEQRLGDMAAGTIVIKESELDYRSSADRKVAKPSSVAEVTYTGLTAEEHRLVRGFLERRIELLPDARAALAQRIAAQLHARHGGEFTDPERYLERLAEGRHHAAGGTG